MINSILSRHIRFCFNVQNQQNIRRQIYNSYCNELINSKQSSANATDILKNGNQNQISSLRSYSKFTSSRDTLLGDCPLSADRAHDLIANLKDSERAVIRIALEKYESLKSKEDFEGQLAATRWRYRFNRLSTVGNVDPTGSFCAFPDDWLKKKAVEKAINPSAKDLWKIFIVNAVPFIAFGFLDNFIMIIAGDSIEMFFGAFMTISTMAAAGLGNTLSDIIGIGSAYYVERACAILGITAPDLTPIQLEMKSSRKAANLGRILGITTGCLLGMLPLLLMKH